MDDGVVEFKVLMNALDLSVFNLVKGHVSSHARCLLCIYNGTKRNGSPFKQYVEIRIK
jgi:hypothetical protein